MSGAPALALAGLAALAAGLLVGVILPDSVAFVLALLALGAGLITAAIVIERRRVQGALQSNRGHFGFGATVRICLFIGIVLLANAVAARATYRWDFTGLAQFTLTSQTLAALAALDQPVEAVSFFTPGATAPVKSYAENLLGEYRLHTNALTVREIDPDLSPDVAREYGIESLGALVGAVVFTGPSGRKRVYGPEIVTEAENAFTGAILEVTGARQKRVVFLTGHGEHAIAGDYGTARQGLRDNLFQVGELDLLASPDVPEGIAGVIVAGPRQALAAAEIDALERYLAKGGSLLLLLDPGSRGGLEGLLAGWGLTVPDGHVVDPASHVAPSTDNLLIDRTRNSFRLSQVNFPGAAAVMAVSDLPQGEGLTPSAGTTPESWLETTPISGAAEAFDPATDIPGPLAIAALVSAKPDQADMVEITGRLAVIGDSDFATNQHFRSGNNGDFFLTSVNWLTTDARVISLDRKPLAIRRLVLTPEQARILHVASIGLMPLILFVAAGVVWWRRR